MTGAHASSILPRIRRQNACPTTPSFPLRSPRNARASSLRFRITSANDPLLFSTTTSRRRCPDDRHTKPLRRRKNSAAQCPVFLHLCSTLSSPPWPLSPPAPLPSTTRPSCYAVEPVSAAPVSATVDSLVQLLATLLPSSPAASSPAQPLRKRRRSRRRRRSSSSASASSTSTSSSASLVASATCWPYLQQVLDDPRRFFSGVIVLPALPPFPYDDMARTRRSIPATPRVVSPSPTPSERLAQEQDDYAGPMTRLARKRMSTPQPAAAAAAAAVDDSSSSSGGDGAGGADRRRSRTRSRSPIVTRRMGELTPVVAHGAARRRPKAAKAGPDGPSDAAATATPTAATTATPTTNGHLRPPAPNGVPVAAGAAAGGWSWRNFSRSPSPLGLIPVHRQWRTFVHKHEVPRKALHVSIGFLVLWLYASGTQTRAVCPYLMGALVPIASVDLLRHRYAPFNRLYVRLLGALMRESEYAGYNGVIFYLLGAWTVLYALPKDVGVISVLLLSWCDTAASTFGRAYGRYTPRIRRGKSLAGSAAAFAVGVATAAWFWGWVAPTIGPMPGDETFLFRGTLRLPPAAASAVSAASAAVSSWLGWAAGPATGAGFSISGALALGVVSVWSGFVAAASEAVDLFGWDDNLTIPVLSGMGIWAFLKVFG